jgi:hypothetical protein
MASDFSVAWQCFSNRAIVFLLWIKLHPQFLIGMLLPKIIFSNKKQQVYEDKNGS